MKTVAALWFIFKGVYMDALIWGKLTCSPPSAPDSPSPWTRSSEVKRSD